MSTAEKAHQLINQAAFFPLLKFFHSQPYERVALKRPPHRRRRSAQRSCLVVCHRFHDGRSARIQLSQIYPFLHYRESLQAKYEVELSFAYLDEVEHICRNRDFDIICFQTWFDIERPEYDRLLSSMRRGGRNPKLVYLDSFAPTDLRLAAMVQADVSLYVKKHVLRALEDYSRPTLGDTGLTDYFSRRYGLSAPERHFEVPESFFPKLVVGPTFFTSPILTWMFERPMLRAPNADRPIDLHARLESKGSEWYERMRREAREAAERLRGRRVLTTTANHVRYMAELFYSKMVFSPFGYGEVCWRDCEAFASGGLLLKPDMSHVRTDPELFVPHETYVPLRWDLEDLEEKVNYYAEHPSERIAITTHAFNRLQRYLEEGGFVEQMRPVLGIESAAVQGKAA